MSGCCGFTMAQSLYFQKFSAVEIDSSFYNLPKPETAARWRNAAPSGFQFAMKAWQVITHDASSPTYKRTRLDPRDRPHCGGFGFNPTIRWAWDETFRIAKTLDAFLVLFQCPPSFRPTKDNIKNLRAFFERAKRGKLSMGWEPRGNWENGLVASLCDELDLVHVVDPFKNLPLHRSRIRYFRLHGISGTSHRFTNAELQQLRQTCDASRTPVYCFFNNIAMSDDATRFQRLITN
jgi:uncharacterized protein YecE (DUF72 family)